MLKSNIKRTSTMMKRLFPTALAVLLLLLAGCTAKPDTSDQSKPAEYYLTDTDLPLDDAARLRAAPDFLTAEQQTLYRQAFALYSAMFDGETTGIDDAFPAADGQAEYDEYTPDGSDYTYISSHSRWQSWADFDRVFWYPTQMFHTGHSNQSKTPRYGMTFIQELSAMKNLMILNIGLIKNLNDQQNQYSIS